MGIFLTVLGVILLSDNIYQIVKLALIVIFIWMTSPVATHLIAKMELLTADKPRRKGRNIR